VAITPNVDGKSFDLILFDRGDAREVLAQVREAAARPLALMYYPSPAGANRQQARLVASTECVRRLQR
jgi:hypothetical protein